jgi:hypothetical protein
MASIRKMKKKVKATNDELFIRRAMSDFRLIKQWSKIDHPNSKSNMKILTENFYRNGKLLV